MAVFRNLAVGILKILGAADVAKTTRAIATEPEQALPIPGAIHQPDRQET